MPTYDVDLKDLGIPNGAAYEVDAATPEEAKQKALHQHALSNPTSVPRPLLQRAQDFVTRYVGQPIAESLVRPLVPPYRAISERSLAPLTEPVPRAGEHLGAGGTTVPPPTETAQAISKEVVPASWTQAAGMGTTMLPGGALAKIGLGAGKLARIGTSAGASTITQYLTQEDPWQILWGTLPAIMGSAASRIDQALLARQGIAKRLEQYGQDLAQTVGQASNGLWNPKTPADLVELAKGVAGKDAASKAFHAARESLMQTVGPDFPVSSQVALALKGVGSEGLLGGERQALPLQDAFGLLSRLSAQGYGSGKGSAQARRDYNNLQDEITSALRGFDPQVGHAYQQMRHEFDVRMTMLKALNAKGVLLGEGRSVTVDSGAWQDAVVKDLAAFQRPQNVYGVPALQDLLKQTWRGGQPGERDIIPGRDTSTPTGGAVRAYSSTPGVHLGVPIPGLNTLQNWIRGPQFAGVDYPQGIRPEVPAALQYLLQQGRGRE